MRKLHELGGHKYTAEFLVAHSDERVKAAGRDILALIERVEELELELEQEQVRLAACSVAALGYANGKLEPHEYGYSASYQDVVRLYDKYKPLRELAIAIDELDLTLQSPDFKWLKAKARKALKGETNGTE